MLAVYLAVLVPAVGLFGALAYREARQSLEAELGERLGGIAQTAAIQLELHGDAGRLARLRPDSETTRARLRETIVAIGERLGVRRIRILTPEFGSLVDTDQEIEPFAEYFELEADRFEIERVLQGDGPRSSVLFEDDAGTPYKRGYAAIVHDGDVIAIIAVEASAEYVQRLQRYRSAIVGFGLLCIALVFVVTLVVSRRVTAPLSRLSAAATQIGQGRLDVEIEPAGRDEIGELARTLETMRRALAARDEEMQMMLAGIAHEIRNPLGGMELFVGILEEELRGDEDRAEYAGKVRRELDYLKSVVGQFLSFARDRDLNVQRFDASALTRELVEVLEPEAADKNIRLAVSTEPSDLELTGDFEALRGVAHNLVRNAIQACASGSEIRVDLGLDGDRRTITVRDDGPGMSAKVSAEVFRPFYTTREKGTGLGLPLAKKLIERHGGTMELETAEGEGTTITIVLPFSEAAPRGAHHSGEVLPRALDDGYDGEMIG